MSPERVIAYIDGYNLYFGLLDARLQTSRWLDLHGVCITLSGAGSRPRGTAGIDLATRCQRQRSPFQPREHRVCSVAERNLVSMISRVSSQSMLASAAM